MTDVARVVVVVTLAASLAGAQAPTDIDSHPTDSAAPASSLDESEAETNPFFFGEIVVVDEEEKPPSGTIDVVDASALRAVGVATVGEALGLMPGVSMSVGGRNEQKIRVRGYEQSNVLLLVDGVPVSDSYFGDLDLGQLPIFDVARVTVTRGAASPLYGPNGLGGVINVTTMQGGDANRIAGELRLTEDRTVLAHASAGGGDERLNWYLGLGAETSDGWPLSNGFEATSFEDGGTRVNSDFRRSSVMARVGLSVGQAGTFYGSVRWINAEKGIPFHTTEPVGFIRFSRFPEWTQSTLAVGYEHDWTNGNLRGQLYGHAFENTLEVFADPDLESLRLESSFSDRVYGGYALGEWGLGERHRIGAAVHLRQDRHRKIERYPDGSQDPSESYQAWTWSISAEDRWQVGDRTSLIGSLALEGLDVQRATSLREIDGGPTLVEDPLTAETLLSPQIEVRQMLSPRWWLSAAVYSRARFPTMRQLYGTDPPNPGLGPQSTTGLDLGAVWAPDPAVTVRGTIFFNRVGDLITRQGRDHPYLNQDEAEIKGVELRLQGKSGAFEYGASWTELDSRFTRSSGGFDEIPFVPDHQIELTGVAHLGRRIDLNGLWLATGQRVAYNRGDRIELGGYSLLGLGVTGRVSVLELSLRVDNVFDHDAEAEPGFPLAGRRFWLGCRFVIRP